MLISIPLSVLALIAIGWYLSARAVGEVEIFVNGLIPSLPGATDKQQSGTTVFIIYTDAEKDDPEREVFRGYADEDGHVSIVVPAKSIGRPIMIRARHAAYKFEDFFVSLTRYGVVRTFKMENDGVYSGTARGKPVPDLQSHFKDATAFAEDKRERLMLSASRRFEHPFARIRVEFWLASYVVLIFAFATDYWWNSAGFKGNIESFTQAVYYSTVTITTLGYGDLSPATDTLRIACSLEAVFGIFVVGFALNSLFRGPRI